ncbi:MAG: hypothetical protein DWQ07_10690 [Chloroflexi bacterium]|nr:MAG: hypothetical protein DWQ07_10690 [Chloroflexota bacterium]MBL1192820.1 hypothetical protein [Chloroflexota bacterium]NOH10113.1 hypothetical protein [Chloroflexota bacterium]
MTGNNYIELIRKFIDKKMSTVEFKRTFFQTFKNEPKGMEKEQFLILDRFFVALDAYWEGWEEDQENPWGITEDTLRKEAQDTLDRLLKLHENDGLNLPP